MTQTAHLKVFVHAHKYSNKPATSLQTSLLNATGTTQEPVAEPSSMLHTPAQREYNQAIM